MLTREMFEEIRGLLSTKNYSQRAIAKRLGVSRGAVQAVARNKCWLYTPLVRSSDLDFQPQRGLPARCPDCGGKVKMPCLACYLRKRQKREKS